MVNNLEVILDNGGGLTVQCDEFTHSYEASTYKKLAEQAAHDVKELLGGADTGDWDGDEPEHRIEYTQDEIRNGGYKVLDEGDLREILAGTHRSLSTDYPYGHGGTEGLFLAALSGKTI